MGALALSGDPARPGENEDPMEAGRMAVVIDPTGAAVGLWQAKAHIGATRVNESGAVIWNELMTGRRLQRLRRQFGYLLTGLFPGWAQPRDEERYPLAVLVIGPAKGAVQQPLLGPDFQPDYQHADDEEGHPAAQPLDQGGTGQHPEQASVDRVPGDATARQYIARDRP